MSRPPGHKSDSLVCWRICAYTVSSEGYRGQRPCFVPVLKISFPQRSLFVMLALACLMCFPIHSNVSFVSFCVFPFSQMFVFYPSSKLVDEALANSN